MRFPLALALGVLPLAFADIEFTTPTRSTIYTAGETITISWKDSGTGPSLSDFTSFTMWLCVGSNTSPYCDHTIGTVGSIFALGMTSAKTVINPVYGGDVGGVYFIKMETVARVGGSTVNYSPRFSIEGMTGSFTADQIAAQEVGDEDPPESVNKVVETTGDAGVMVSSLIKVPYTMQTGPTMYAPMQSQPGRSIMVDTPRRQYPTSAYTVYTRVGGKPDRDTTLTVPWDYTVYSRVNTASPAPQPSDDAMQRFLNRWKD